MSHPLPSLYSFSISVSNGKQGSITYEFKRAKDISDFIEQIKKRPQIPSYERLIYDLEHIIAMMNETDETVFSPTQMYCFQHYFGSLTYPNSSINPTAKHLTAHPSLTIFIKQLDATVSSLPPVCQPWSTPEEKVASLNSAKTLTDAVIALQCRIILSICDDLESRHTGLPIQIASVRATVNSIKTFHPENVPYAQKLLDEIQDNIDCNHPKLAPLKRAIQALHHTIITDLSEIEILQYPPETSRKAAQNTMQLELDYLQEKANYFAKEEAFEKSIHLQQTILYARMLLTQGEKNPTAYRNLFDLLNQATQNDRFARDWLWGKSRTQRLLDRAAARAKRLLDFAPAATKQATIPLQNTLVLAVQKELLTVLLKHLASQADVLFSKRASSDAAHVSTIWVTLCKTLCHDANSWVSSRTQAIELNKIKIKDDLTIENITAAIDYLEDALKTRKNIPTSTLTLLKLTVSQLKTQQGYYSTATPTSTPSSTYLTPPAPKATTPPSPSPTFGFRR